MSWDKPKGHPESLFDIIRKESKFCSRCGGKLDLKFKNYHLPFCNKCRNDLFKIAIERTSKRLSDLNGRRSKL